MLRGSPSGVALAVVTLVLAGCCTTVPEGEKYFDRRRSAEETVRLFRYSVEARQFGAAYRCLVSGFREKHSEREVSLAVRYGSLEGIGLREFIVEARQSQRVEPVRGFAKGEAAWVTLVFLEDPEDDATTVREHSLFVVREDGEWRIDPEMTRPEHERFLRELSGSMPRPGRSPRGP